MTTKVLNHDDEHEEIDSLTVGDGDARLVPALGESWAHATTTRILLASCDDETTATTGGGMQRESTRRICCLVKSPHKAAGTAYFSITDYGVRDCCYDAPPVEASVRAGATSSGDGYNSRKKMRALGN